MFNLCLLVLVAGIIIYCLASRIQTYKMVEKPMVSPYVERDAIPLEDGYEMRTIMNEPGFHRHEPETRNEFALHYNRKFYLGI